MGEDVGTDVDEGHPPVHGESHMGHVYQGIHSSGELPSTSMYASDGSLTSEHLILSGQHRKTAKCEPSTSTMCGLAVSVCCRFWRGLSPEDVKLVTDAIIVRTFKRDAVIVNQGEEATFIGLLLTGEAEIRNQRCVTPRGERYCLLRKRRVDADEELLSDFSLTYVLHRQSSQHSPGSTVVGKMLPGHLFGEVAAFNCAEWPATVTSCCDETA
eukprot:9269502-Pyramimonas_sp.AAC.1